MGYQEWALLITLSILWGGSYFFNAIAVKELPTFSVTVSRVGIAAVILLLVMRVTGTAMPSDRAVWRAFFGMGLLNNVIPFSLIVWGQHHIASGLAAIFNATTPLFTALVAHWLTTDEKLTARHVAGILTGLVGVAVVIGPHALAVFDASVAAQIAVLAAALSYAFAGVYGRRFKTLGVAPMATATGQVCASSMLLIPAALTIDKPWTLPIPSTAAIGSLIGVAALSTALAYIIYFRILATAGANNLLLVTFLIPVSACLLGVLVLGEILLASHLAGMVIIGVGLIIIDGRLLGGQS
ncbi:MAG: EamA family transporter [Gammaproteobacteria bacterium]|nr:EamA family transporter [Gammaproteobacteria bacterium]